MKISEMEKKINVNESLVFAFEDIISFDMCMSGIKIQNI